VLGRGHNDHTLDTTVLNDLDRFYFVMDVIDHLPQTGDTGICLK